MKGRQHLWFMSTLAAAAGLSAWLLLTVGVQSDAAVPALAWTRVREPVILTGKQLPFFDGVDLDDLFVYAYTASTWEPVPFQFDQVDASGAYTVGNGLLDGNDELVFMAMDLGDEAGPGAWIADADSQDHPRYRVQVTNPLNPVEQGWVYVYRSTTLAPTLPADYADWNAAQQKVEAGTYSLGFAPAVHIGVDSLELNGSGVDALDRTKLRINVTCHLPFPLPPIDLTLTEEALASQSEMRPNVDGPVRVGSGDANGGWWFYHSVYQLYLVAGGDALEPPEPCQSLDIHWLRLSSDWLSPTVTAMTPMTYYDANTTGGVPVDGHPDSSVPGALYSPWIQISGAQGSTVQVADITMEGGTLSNYYRDDQSADPADTGEDQRSFGDAGFRLDAPAGQAHAEILTYVLGPGEPNVGTTYQAYHDHPLEVVVRAEGDVYQVHLPIVLRRYP